MSDPRTWEQSIGYLVHEVAGIQSEIERLLRSTAEIMQRLDERLTQVGALHQRLCAVQSECQQAADGELADYGARVRAVLEERYEGAMLKQGVLVD